MENKKFIAILRQWIIDGLVAKCQRNNAPIPDDYTSDADYKSANNIISKLEKAPNLGKISGLYHFPIVSCLGNWQPTNFKACKRLLGIFQFMLDNQFVPVASAKVFLLMLILIAINENRIALHYDDDNFKSLLVNDESINSFCKGVNWEKVTWGSVGTQLSLAKNIAKAIGIISINTDGTFSINIDKYFNKALIEILGIKSLIKQ